MPSLINAPKVVIRTIPLTPVSFAPFGSIVPAPLPSSVTSIPTTAPRNAVYANQNSALKYAEIAPLISNYHLSFSNTSARPITSRFSCFPRSLRSRNDQHIFDLQVLERHPFTTQTFIPISSPLSSQTRAIIIVAPTLALPPPSSTLTPYFSQQRQGGLPDLENVKAFIAEPGVGVTYGSGTWHAPMVVVGKERMDFVVTQWVNGRAEDDCQEVDITEGVEVVVDLNKGSKRFGPKL